jgi:hypothetical protein
MQQSTLRILQFVNPLFLLSTRRTTTKRGRTPEPSPISSSRLDQRQLYEYLLGSHFIVPLHLDVQS